MKKKNGKKHKRYFINNKINEKGFTLVELIAVIAILALLVGLSAISFINIRKKTLEKQYDNLISYIETKAANYTNDTGITTVNVQKLIDEGYLEPDDETNIYEPINNKSINCNVINSEFIDGDIISKFDRDNDYIDNNNECKAYEQTGLYQICVMESGVCKPICEYDAEGNCVKRTDKLWRNDTIVLDVVKADKTEFASGTTFNWSSTDGNTNPNNLESQITVTGLSGTAIQSIYTVRVIEGVGKTGEAKATIGIDKQDPIVTSIDVKDEAGWQGEKELEISVSDYAGSGVKGIYYSDIAIDNCPSTASNYSKSVTNNKITLSWENNEIYVCVMDNVNNYSKTATKKTIERIDSSGADEIELTADPVAPNWTNKVKLTGRAIDKKSGLIGYYFSTSSTAPSKDSSSWKKIDESKKNEEIKETYDVTENNNYYFHVIDKIGNTSSASVYVNNIDTEVDKAEIKIKSKYPSNTTYSKSVDLRGTALDKVSGIAEYQFTTSSSKTEPTSGWTSVGIPVVNTTKNYDLTLNTSGTKTYYFWVKDAAGNTKRSTNGVQVKIDNDNPTCTNGNITKSTNLVTASASCNDSTSKITIYYYFQRTTSSNRPSTPSASLFTSTSKTYSTQCEYYYHGWAMAKDEADNTSNIIYLGYQYSGACCNPKEYQNSQRCNTSTGYYEKLYKNACTGSTFYESSYETCCNKKQFVNKTCNTSTGKYQNNYKNACTNQTLPSESTNETCCETKVYTGKTCNKSTGKYQNNYKNGCTNKALPSESTNETCCNTKVLDYNKQVCVNGYYQRPYINECTGQTVGYSNTGVSCCISEWRLQYEGSCNKKGWRYDTYIDSCTGQTKEEKTACKYDLDDCYYGECTRRSSGNYKQDRYCLYMVGGKEVEEWYSQRKCSNDDDDDRGGSSGGSSSSGHGAQAKYNGCLSYTMSNAKCNYIGKTFGSNQVQCAYECYYCQNGKTPTKYGGEYYC